jgi:hypothetical protein
MTCVRHTVLWKNHNRLPRIYLLPVSSERRKPKHDFKEATRLNLMISVYALKHRIVRLPGFPKPVGIMIIEQTSSLKAYRVDINGRSTVLKKVDGFWVAKLLSVQECEAIGAYIEMNGL